MNRLREKYNKEVVPKLIDKYNYSSVMEVPKIEKIVINIGVGEAVQNSKLLEAAVKELELITDSKPVVTKAKKSIAGFKLREGQEIGCKVISPKAFDGRGNYTLGIKEQMIFAEIEYDNIVKTRGMDIVFVTTAKTNEEAFDLLNEIGIPFRK